MTLPEILAAFMLVGLVAYVLFAGADFGGGVWDLLATGPRAHKQRELIQTVLAPVWEANHVWLIFVVVLLFGGFPPAYAFAGVALHLPLTAMLVGIVFRGSAFTFRHYGGGQTWGRVFAVASVVTPIFLGIIVGAITGETLRMGQTGSFTDIYVDPWLGLFPIAVGLFTLALFAFLAAVYLTCETDDPDLRDDFRVRALFAGVAVGGCALAAGIAAPRGSHFVQSFLHSPWTWPLHIATGIAAISTFAALGARRFRIARAAAAAQTVLILAGWALSQHPYIIAPDVTIAGAAAPRATLILLLGASIAGGAILIPSLYWLFRIFRKATGASSAR